jgi:hypothetical protein
MPDGASGTDGETAVDQLEDTFERLFRSGRINASIAWLVVAVLLLVFVESVVDLDWQWVVFVAATGGVALLPPIAYRNWRVMLRWELLVLATLPILVRAVLGGSLGLFATYVSLAGLALLVTVELHMFTSLQVTHWFAVVFVVLATLASGAAWAVVRWNADIYLGTTYLRRPELSQRAANEALMIEFLWITVAGFVAGVLFDAYFKRRDRRLRRSLRRVIGR